MRRKETETKSQCADTSTSKFGGHVASRPTPLTQDLCHADDEHYGLVMPYRDAETRTNADDGTVVLLILSSHGDWVEDGGEEGKGREERKDSAPP